MIAPGRRATTACAVDLTYRCGVSDSGQPEARTAPWAPLADESDHRGALESGAVLRSPGGAVTVSAAEPRAVSGWPWDGVDGQSGGPNPTGPVIATEQLYRDDSGWPGSGGNGGTHATESLPLGAAIPTASPVTDPFAMRATADEPTRDGGGMKTWSIVLTDVIVTTVAAILDLRLYGQLTWITGGAFVAACLITSLSVRRQDLAVAVITPPLAFVLSVAISAQTVALGSSGSLLLREGKIIITSLAFNAPYVFAGTGLALVIVALRALRRAN